MCEEEEVEAGLPACMTYWNWELGKDPSWPLYASILLLLGREEGAGIPEIKDGVL